MMCKPEVDAFFILCLLCFSLDQVYLLMYSIKSRQSACNGLFTIQIFVVIAECTDLCREGNGYHSSETYKMTRVIVYHPFQVIGSAGMLILFFVTNLPSR